MYLVERETAAIPVYEPLCRYATADWAAQALKARLEWRLYAVTDPRQNEKWGRSNVEAVAAAIEGGVTVVQLREKDAEGGRFFSEAEAVIRVARPHGVRGSPTACHT